MNRKLAMWLLIVALVISLTSNIVLILNYPQSTTSRDLTTLVRATSAGPHTLEIVDSWDGASNDVLEQVVETLFSHDLRDPDLPRINLLAESYHWKNKTTLQIELRKGILFHDGTSFNASAVKWNLDRLQYLINATRTNYGAVAYTQSIWMRPDGKTPIINNTVTVGEYNITISLNGPYGPFLDTLTYINAGMISPTFHEANEHSFIPINGDICGTGPFTYERFTPDVEVLFSRWEGYWRHVAYFKKLQFKIFDDVDTARSEMLSGEIDLNGMANHEDILAYEASEDITVKHYTDDTGIPSLVYQYLSLNNKKYNQTWRRAMSFAVNYTYIIEDLLSGNAVKANSPISPGFGIPYNESAFAPDFNITKAREIMVSMGFGDMEWTDQQWITMAEVNPFRSIGYFTGPFYNQFRVALMVAMIDWFKLIGVRLYENDPCADDPFIQLICFPSNYSKLEIFGIGWAPDYLSVYIMLEPLFKPRSYSNYALVNDTKLNTMMELALETTDDEARDAIYKNIQGYMTEACFHIPLYHSKVIWIHSADLRNVSYNAMGKFQAYEIWRL